MIDQNYNKILKEVLNKGTWYDDPNRKDVKRLEIPSYTFRHEFKDGFPAISTKKLAWKSVVTELLWFLKGDTNIKYLLDNGCNIWNKDAYAFYEKCYEKYPLGKEKLSKEEWIEKQKQGYSKHSGDLGMIYGYYWRNFNGVDQITELIKDMINKPMSSELIVSARNPSHKGVQALPCCHYGFQIVMIPLKKSERIPQNQLINFLIEPTDEELDNRGFPKYGFELHFQMRTVDTFLGMPFNIASYALLAEILYLFTGHIPLAIQGDWKKVHLYDNSIEAAKEQLKRTVSNEPVKLERDRGELQGQLSNYWYRNEDEDRPSIDDMLSFFRPEFFTLENYNPQPTIKVEMLERR